MVAITPSNFSNVALRKESVDRNFGFVECLGLHGLSLSARRAWIEIVRGFALPYKLYVALRKESVDRNKVDGVVFHGKNLLSLSARRAWIEIRASVSESVM